MCVFVSDECLMRLLVCSDFPGPSEAHLEDFCVIGSDLNDNPGDSAQPIMCEIESSAQCPRGWAYYRDATGTEGADSCVLVSPYPVASWSQADTACTSMGSGAHLLTVSGSSRSTGLWAFASSVTAGGGVYIGCSQSSEASTPGSGWSWVDSTSPSNLNCGSTGCDLWSNDRPR